LNWAISKERKKERKQPIRFLTILEGGYACKDDMLGKLCEQILILVATYGKRKLNIVIQDESSSLSYLPLSDERSSSPLIFVTGQNHNTRDLEYENKTKIALVTGSRYREEEDEDAVFFDYYEDDEQLDPDEEREFIDYAHPINARLNLFPESCPSSVIPPPVNANPLPASAACSTRHNEISSVPVENLRETSIETSPTSREEEQSLKNQSISNSFSSLSTFIKPRDVWRAIYKLEKVHARCCQFHELEILPKTFLYQYEESTCEVNPNVNCECCKFKKPREDNKPYKPAPWKFNSNGNSPSGFTLGCGHSTISVYQLLSKAIFSQFKLSVILPKLGSNGDVRFLCVLFYMMEKSKNDNIARGTIPSFAKDSGLSQLFFNDICDFKSDHPLRKLYFFISALRKEMGNKKKINPATVPIVDVVSVSNIQRVLSRPGFAPLTIEQFVSSQGVIPH
jgi:hypothetical protein